MEFIFVLLICPITVIIASIISYYLVKKWFLTPILTFIVFTILTFTRFNETFFFWVIIYTILSIIVSLFFKFTKKN
ncbi:DUF2651 family protein [Lysinibacillus sp. 54212]|uniref:DUF2651 family protein n=1 Tax=Lysinibacillus sp. 54212 TaxID=3119829 RepID=UPI002FCA096F